MALRNVHSFQEIGVRRATFVTDGSLTFTRDSGYGTTLRHAPVVITGNMIVGLAPAGATPFGSLERLDADGSATVAFEGAVEYAMVDGFAGFGAGVVSDGVSAVRAPADATTEVGKGTAVETAHEGQIIVHQ